MNASAITPEESEKAGRSKLLKVFDEVEVTSAYPAIAYLQAEMPTTRAKVRETRAHSPNICADCES